MILMARDRGYPEMLGEIRGRRVTLWTCETCARLCFSFGGRASAEALAARLAEDGVEVSGVVSSSACCLMPKAERMASEAGGCDLIVALCCDVGARNASAATGAEVLNPAVTFGPGYQDSDGTPRLVSIICGETVQDEPLPEAARRAGCQLGPFV